MKSKLTIICLLFVLYSCSLFRTTTTETKQKNDITKETEVSKNTESVQTQHAASQSEIGTKNISNSVFNQLEYLEGDFSETDTTYDTSQPPDSFGKHPVINVKTKLYHIHKKKDTNTKEQSQLVTNEKENAQVDLSKYLFAKSDSIAKLTDKSKSDSSNKEGFTNWRLWFGMGVGSVIAIVLAIKFGKKLILPRFP